MRTVPLASVRGAGHNLHMSVTKRRFLVILLLGLLCALPANAQTDRLDGAAFAEVITRQITAFARDDGAAAFAFASPDIRRQFATPERFMSMVRTSFRPVYRPRSYSFGPPALIDGIPVQPVRVIGPNGHGTVALYQMERQPEASWRIAGVTLHPTGERGI